MNGRGSLIVIDGCDKTGKSTQCTLLSNRLKIDGYNVKVLHFPNRSTKIGKIIDDYLTNKVQYNDKTIHLLFSANRWEQYNEIKKLLYVGTTLIVDRYAFSGVAYTAAKGIGIEWCKYADSGLPKPDIVFHMVPKTGMKLNGADGDMERYEIEKFQRLVLNEFTTLKQSNWIQIDADRPITDIHIDITTICKKVITNSLYEDLGELW